MNEQNYTNNNANIAETWGSQVAAMQDGSEEYINSASRSAGDSSNYGVFQWQSVQFDDQGGETPEQLQHHESRTMSFAGNSHPNLDIYENTVLGASAESTRNDYLHSFNSQTLMYMSMKTTKGMLLRQWIKQAMQATKGEGIRVGTVSIPYLELSLKVALSLTKQIIEAEELARDGITKKLDALPIGRNADWARHTTVFSREDNSSGEHQHAKSEPKDELFASASRKADSTGSAISSNKGQLDFLSVDSAEIKCPKSGTSNYFSSDHNGVQDKQQQRMYQLALVFYELFSGELPPSNLRDLASSRGAFVSLPTLTPIKESDEAQCELSESKRRHSTTGHGKSSGPCQSSFAYLLFIGIPGPICHLVFNMLDCVHGVLSGNESYTSMSDIAFDLQLMLDKPKFLRGLNMEKQPTSGLQLEQLVIPRDKEIQSILDSYQKGMAGSREVVIVEGESGVGKSTLAKCAGSSIMSKGGLFLMGKFDQMQQARPFSALAAALDQYCVLLLSHIDSDWASIVIEKLNVTLGRDAWHLVNVLPKLGFILGDKSNTSWLTSEGASDFGNAVQRIQYLLCKFVEVISMTSLVSITLCLDDVQWADQASISVMQRVLTHKHGKFFFISCCRDKEMSNDHPFWDMIETVRASGVSKMTIELNSITQDALNTALSDLMCLPPRLVKPLSCIVHTKTKGNLLFLVQMLLSLSRDGMLRIDLSTQRWIWDEETIYSAKLPDNVALCFAAGICTLPSDCQVALQTISMFGTSTTNECIQALECHLNITLAEPLRLAITEGLVSNIKGAFHFNHDCIQETCYNMIPENDRRHKHLLCGQGLIKSLQENDSDMLFTAVNQINLATPAAITDAREYCTMAHHNLNAGKKAIEMSDFILAYSFFQCGIGFLREHENHWKNQYPLSLELFNMCAKAALSSENFHGLKKSTDEVLQHARCFEDKTDAYFTLMLSLMYTAKTSEALQQGIETVARLGQRIPVDPSKLELQQNINQTQMMIKGKTEHDILNLEIMTEPKKLVIMKFLSALQSISFLIKPDLHHYLVLQMIQTMVSYGVSPSSPVALACCECVLLSLVLFLHDVN